MRNLIVVSGMLLILSCNNEPATAEQVVTEQKEQQQGAEADQTSIETSLPQSSTNTKNIETGNTSPGALVEFSKTLIGIPYLYGSINPANGFDCSGFITHVFNHFKIAVPRSSIDFTDVKQQITLEEAKPGDIVLFTGTNEADRDVGHMGIIVSEGEPKEFIHSTSGKAYGVTITPLNGYYMNRFVKVIRIFKQNDL